MLSGYWSIPQRCPLNTGFTVFIHLGDCAPSSFPTFFLGSVLSHSGNEVTNFLCFLCTWELSFQLNIMIELKKILIKKPASSNTCKWSLSLESQGLVSRHPLPFFSCVDNFLFDFSFALHYRSIVADVCHSYFLLFS